MYAVIGHHHRKAWIKGDLESETIQISANMFKLRREVINFLKDKEHEAKRAGHKTKLHNKRGEMPELWIWTNNTWIHENTGEEERETYFYRATKK